MKLQNGGDLRADSIKVKPLMAGSAPLIGANFDDIPVNNLILRRPRSGRLEGWATHENVEKQFAATALLPTLRDGRYAASSG
jgi:hypothetical protein